MIETVVEDLATKRELFAEFGQIVMRDTILATNTSTLPVVELAMASGDPIGCAGSTSSTPRR